MNQELAALVITAASLGFIHTVLGPDHYIPFVAMSRARKWSDFKTLSITVACGVGHVASSVVIGLIGVALGIAVGSLESVESVRGDIAAWVLIGFGLVYMVWGIRRAIKRKLHSHSHTHGEKANITPWILFTIFVLGPCEPLIPILMYPAAQKSTSGMILVASVFSIVTIATMTIAVFVLSRGIRLFPTKSIERYSHALAGFVILLCGMAIQFGL